MASLFGAVFLTFDPFYYMEGQLALRYYGTTILPEQAVAPFQFVLFLYSITSISIAIMQYIIITKWFPTKNKWAYYSIFISFLVWFVLCFIFQIYHGNYFYIKAAVIPFFILFLPILFIRRYFN